MSTSLSNILANDARQKARLLVSKVLPKGVYGDVDAGDVLAFRVEENPVGSGGNVNKVLVRKGTVLADPDLIVWSDNDIVLDIPAPDPLVARYDVIYIDAVADTGDPDFKVATGTMSVPAPADPVNHTHVPIWRIKRLANTPAVTYAACIYDPQGTGGADDEPGKDMREKPPSEPHNHQLLAGATDVSATAAELNQIADGIRAAASAGRLSDLAESNATKTQLNELVGGASTILHSHNSANSIQTPSGAATPLAGVINFALSQNGSTSDISASGNTVLFNVAGDGLGDHVAEQDLNMATHKVINVADPTANQDAATKKYVDDEISGGLNGFAKYNAEQDFDLNPTADPVGKRIHNLEDGAVTKDAVNKGQLDAAVAGLGGSLANLDERYKIGLPGGPTDPSAPNYHLNKQAHGNIDLHDYKVQNSGSINKVTDLPNTLVTKQYVDDEIAEAIEDLSALISGFFKNPAETDLVMTGPNGQKTIVALKNPAASDHAANKAYVDARINHVIGLIPTEPGVPPDGDNLGDHTATMDLDMANNAIQGVVMPGQDPLELSINDRLAVNRKFVVDVFNGIPQPDIPVTDLTGFAKIGTDFETAKNLSPLNMAVAEGGEVNVRGTDGRGLLVIKKKPNSAPGEDVFINSRIQGVEDPIDNQDAATKGYVDSLGSSYIKNYEVAHNIKVTTTVFNNITVGGVPSASASFCDNLHKDTKGAELLPLPTSRGVFYTTDSTTATVKSYLFNELNNNTSVGSGSPIEITCLGSGKKDSLFTYRGADSQGTYHVGNRSGIVYNDPTFMVVYKIKNKSKPNGKYIISIHDLQNTAISSLSHIHISPVLDELFVDLNKLPSNFSGISAAGNPFNYVTTNTAGIAKVYGYAEHLPIAANYKPKDNILLLQNVGDEKYVAVLFYDSLVPVMVTNTTKTIQYGSIYGGDKEVTATWSVGNVFRGLTVTPVFIKIALTEIPD